MYIKGLGLVFYFLLYLNDCKSQEIPEDKASVVGEQIPASIHNYNDFNDKTDIYVIDGLLVYKGNPLPQKIDIVSIRTVSDEGILTKIGVKEINKTYTFYNTEVTAYHRFIYQNTPVPYEWGFNVPIIIDKELILPSSYKKLDKLNTNLVKETIFLSKESPIIKNDTRIIYGAILVKTIKIN